eukprot:COSAG01_NODE_16446_length_1236_cov_1.019349_1_plen_220_part_01
MYDGGLGTASDAGYAAMETTLTGEDHVRLCGKATTKKHIQVISGVVVVLLLAIIVVAVSMSSGDGHHRQPGRTGPTQAKTQEPCGGVSCGGHGSCQAGTCSCVAGWSGIRCETQTGGGGVAPTPPASAGDSCAHVSCGSHGSCQAGACRCTAGWSGPACQWQDSDRSCPAGAAAPTRGSRYCGGLVGNCRGPGGNGEVNQKYSGHVTTEAACIAGCDAEP